MTNENGTQTTETPQSTEIVETQVPFEVPEGFRLVTDEEMEQLAQEIATSHKEKWEVQEIVDNAVAAGEMNDLMRNELLWEFKGQGGKMVRGLTAAMIAHLAKVEGISEEIDRRVYNGEGDYHDFEVVVSIADPLHPDGKSYRSGFAEEPKIVNGKYDKFGKIKAYTKAFSRACKKLLPQDLMMAAVFKLARIVPADWTPKPQKALPAAQQDTATLNAMNACFKAFGEKEQTLLDLGVSKSDFWENLKGVLGVQSRNDMTVAQWNAVAKSLNTVDFGDIVRDVLVKCGVNLANLESEPDRNE